MVKKNQTTAGEIGDDIIKLIKNHWIKIILIIAVTGIVGTGFKCSCGDMKVEKSAVIKYESLNTK